MSGTTIDSSMPFDPYATSFDASQLQTYSDFSPVSIFDPVEEFGTDFTSDSAASPLSPLSPALSASSFGFPQTEGWTAWDSAELSPEPENLFAPCQPFDPSSISPAINPMDLAMPNSQSPLFQSPQVMLATVPSQQQQPMAPLPTPPMAARTTNDTTTTTTTTITTTKRYPSRALKRKSTSSASEDEPILPPAKLLSTTTSQQQQQQQQTTSTSTTARRPSTTTKPTSKEASALGPKKTAHNMIEKRYRTNLNDKITQLRDAVPSLRLMAQRQSKLLGGGNPTDAADFDEAEDGTLEGFTGGNGANATAGAGAKLNKATILSKATEYILQLERRNHGLETENSALRGRMEGLEMMLMGRGGVQGGVVVQGWN